MLVINLVLLAFAVLCFAFAAFNVSYPPRLNFTGLGLLFLSLAMLAGSIKY